MNKKHLIIFLIAILLLLVSTLLLPKTPEISVTANKTGYSRQEFPVITIRNNAADSLCLSGCYPYYLEKNDGSWESYNYDECKEPDLIKRCIKPKEAVGLELLIEQPLLGLHRVAIPVCLNCQVGNNFKEDKKLYSNEFLIN